MIRRAFTMRLKPEAAAQYRYHHDHIWPELVDEIERSGIASITTFQRGLDLFLVSEISDEAAWDRLWNSPVHRRWAEVMEPLMHLRADGIVDADELTEVFHLATNGAPVANVQAIVREFADADEMISEIEVASGLDDARGFQETLASSPTTDVESQAALADALSALSDALDREIELRGEEPDVEDQFLSIEVQSVSMVTTNPLAELIADTTAHAAPLPATTNPEPSAAPIEPPATPQHAPRRRKVSTSARKTKPVAKKSTKSKKKPAPRKAMRAAKSAKKSVVKKKPGKKAAKKRAVTSAKKSAKKSSRRVKKRR